MQDIVQEHLFPCTTCGSDLRYKPGGTALQCDHCGGEQPIEDIGPWGDRSLRELSYRRAINDELPAEETEEVRVVSCSNCNAQVEFNGASHATECPFCATPIVADTGIHRHIKPRGVLPFELSDEDARAAMTAWMGNLWFAPGTLLEFAAKGRKMQGIYVPYWTYDADTKTEYDGQRGTEFTERRQVNVMVDGKSQTRTESVTKVRWFATSGRVARAFNDVLVLASKSLPKRYTDALAPWDLEKLTPYQPEYLAGYAAEGYQVSLQDGYEEARAIMDAQIRSDVRTDIGGDQQKIDNLETVVSNLTFKHVLLPVWMAAYKYQGETYRFVVNGRTGAVEGERPWSRWKIAFAVLTAIAIAVGIGYYFTNN